MLALYISICLLAAAFLYQLVHSPLGKLPGPFYTKLTTAWLKYKEFSGCRRQYVHDLHQRYGAVVRLAPNEVSFASPEAVKEIYSSGGSGYDKTEFYNLFQQFNTRYDRHVPHDFPECEAAMNSCVVRTLFSTLNKYDVLLPSWPA